MLVYKQCNNLCSEKYTGRRGQIGTDGRAWVICRMWATNSELGHSPVVSGGCVGVASCEAWRVL